MPTTSATPDTHGKPGRPRRYQADAERQLLLDAGFEVIRRKGYRQATVTDILAEAGLATRSFYRHFAAKDELLHALFRRDAEQFASAVTGRVEAAATSPEAVVVWMDEVLGFGFGRPRAERAQILASVAAAGALDADEIRRALRRLVEPLAAALAAGRADGSLPHAEPAGDAALVSAVTWEASRQIRALSSTAAKQERRAALLSFVSRALGADLS